MSTTIPRAFSRQNAHNQWAYYPGADFDFDFINRRYFSDERFWGESSFLTLDEEVVFGANGITPLASSDISFRLAGSSTGAGTIAVRCFLTATPSAARGIVTWTDRSAAEDESIRFLQQTTNGNISTGIRDGAVLQQSTTLTGSLNVTRGAGISFDTNDVSTSNDGSSGSADTSATMPTPIILRIGNLNALTVGLAGAVGRVVGFRRKLSQAELNTLVTTIIA